MVHLSHTYMTIRKTIVLTIRIFVSKAMSLFFNMLSRFFIAFLLRSKRLLISWLRSPSAVIFGAQENKDCHCFHCFSIYLPWSDGTRCHDLCFWMLNFSVLFSFVTQSCPTLCDPWNTTGLPVHHQLLELAQTHVHRISDAMKPSHPLSSPSSPVSIFPSIRVFSNESVLCIRWPKYWSCSFSISPSNEL